MKSDFHAVYGIAFVHIYDVCLGSNLLKPLLTQYRATATFISYFESNWLNNPLYPISMWNCYDSTLSDDARTNNHSERSNSALNIAAGCSNPLKLLNEILKLQFIISIHQDFDITFIIITLIQTYLNI